VMEWKKWRHFLQFPRLLQSGRPLLLNKDNFFQLHSFVYSFATHCECTLVPTSNWAGAIAGAIPAPRPKCKYFFCTCLEDDVAADHLRQNQKLHTKPLELEAKHICSSLTRQSFRGWTQLIWPSLYAFRGTRNSSD
jgi:hypothetical protein